MIADSRLPIADCKTSINREMLKTRTRDFCVRIIKMVDVLPKTTSGRTIASQLVRAATSVGANYRAVCRARSDAEFVSKLSIVVEESDECCFWLEIITESGMLDKKQVSALAKEADELTAIFASSRKTASLKNQQSAIGNRQSA